MLERGEVRGHGSVGGVTYALNLAGIFDDAQLRQRGLHVVATCVRIGKVLARRAQSRKLEAEFCSPLSG